MHFPNLSEIMRRMWAGVSSDGALRTREHRHPRRKRQPPPYRNHVAHYRKLHRLKGAIASEQMTRKGMRRLGTAVPRGWDKVAA